MSHKSHITAADWRHCAVRGKHQQEGPRTQQQHVINARHRQTRPRVISGQTQITSSPAITCAPIEKKTSQNALLVVRWANFSHPLLVSSTLSSFIVDCVVFGTQHIDAFLSCVSFAAVSTQIGSLQINKVLIYISELTVTRKNSYW